MYVEHYNHPRILTMYFHIRKNVILLLLIALHAGAEVFKTNEIPVVPAEDLVPPPEDQESLLVRFTPNDQQAQKSFFQRVVTWFGFNGDQQLKNAKKQPQKQQSQKQNGYVYENPAKPFSPQPPKLQQGQPQQGSGYNYEDPTKIIQNGFRFEPSPAKLQQQPFAGYNYDPPKLQQQNQNGYNYDPPKSQQQNQNGYNYDPPPVKLQQQPILQQQTGYTYNPPANPLKLQEATPTGYTYSVPPQKLQEPSKLPQLGGYNYPAPANPLKLQQRPASFNDLVSSAASPTAVYGLPPINQYNQAQTSDSYPCNQIPWLPMFPNPQEMDLLRAKLQAKNPGYFYPQPTVYQNIQQISRPQPEKFTQQLNAHTYLPPRQRPLRQPSQSQINSINSLPFQSTAQPFKAPPSTISSSYLPSQKIVLPVETTQHNLVPIPVPSLSITPVPPLYDPKPFTANDAQANAFGNGFYINGKLVTPTGLSTTSVQSLQYYSQNHPVTQSQNLIDPTNGYGVPPAPTQGTPIGTYGTPSNTYAVPPVTYGPPTNTYGTPPIRLTAEVTESSVFGRFSASQPFTARPTLSSIDQSRLSSSNVVNSNLADKPIIISDSAVDASESTRSPQDANTISDENQPILQVLQELNVTSTPPQGFQYAATSTQPSIAISSASQIKKKEIRGNSDRETPLDLLDTRVNGDRVPDFKFMRNTWKPLPPNPFSNPAGLSVVTTAAPFYSSPITPSSASAAFQSHTPHDGNSIGHSGQENNDGTKTKKVQIIIPYTSKSRPSPFKNNVELQSFESSAGWSNSQHHDDHNSEESQVISAATPSPKGVGSSSKRKHSPALTNIIAKNIRELLRREHLKNVSNLSSFDLAKLQKNIDGWTEQEFSMTPNRASTISLLAQPKHIPFEYLTTTQSIQDMLTTETIQPTTDYPTTLFEIGESTESDDSQDDGEGEVMDDKSEDENEIRSPDNTDIGQDEQEAIQAAEEIENEDFKRINYLKALENNHVSGSENHNIFYATNPPPPTRTTTPVPPCSTSTQSPDDNETIVRTTVLPSTDELWNKLKSLLSSSSEQGKEKVYIVTPQPYPYFESEKIASDDENEVGGFKSPRFLVRPTPGASTGRSFSSVARITLKPRAKRLQTTTVKTTWNETPTEPTDPVTEIFRSSTHSHSVVNGHAHAQAFSYVTPRTFIDDAPHIQVEEEEEDDENDDENREDFDLVRTHTHRRSLHEYKH